MATRERPGAITHADIFLSMVLDELEDQGKTLNAILDRLPTPQEGAGGPAADDTGPTTVHISEPETAAQIVAAVKKRAVPAKKTTKAVDQPGR